MSPTLASVCFGSVTSGLRPCRGFQDDRRQHLDQASSCYGLRKQVNLDDSPLQARGRWFEPTCAHQHKRPSQDHPARASCR